MSNINYIAKRSIVPVVFFISQSTVSASSVDNSFNDSTNDLSGLSANEWVYVTGFANTENNGWHQLLSDSTANKIIINTDTALVTEAAGNAVTLQGYLHGLNVSYDLDFDLQRYTPQPKEIKTTITAKGGNRSTLYDRTDNFYDCQTSYINESELPLWDEFFASVAAGEGFIFDAYGTSGTPNNPVSVEIDGAYAYQRVGTTGKFYISFRVKI